MSKLTDRVLGVLPDKMIELGIQQCTVGNFDELFEVMQGEVPELSAKQLAKIATDAQFSFPTFAEIQAHNPDKYPTKKPRKNKPRKEKMDISQADAVRDVMRRNRKASPPEIADQVEADYPQFEGKRRSILAQVSALKKKKPKPPKPTTDGSTPSGRRVKVEAMVKQIDTDIAEKERQIASLKEDVKNLRSYRKSLSGFSDRILDVIERYSKKK